VTTATNLSIPTCLVVASGGRGGQEALGEIGGVHGLRGRK
jgi:hypothetical protein